MDKVQVGKLVQEVWEANREAVPQKELLRRMRISRAHFNKVARASYPEGPSTDFLQSFATALGGNLVLKIGTPATPITTITTDPLTADCARVIEALPEPSRRAILGMVEQIAVSLAVDLPEAGADTGSQDVSPGRRRTPRA